MVISGVTAQKEIVPVVGTDVEDPVEAEPLPGDQSEVTLDDPTASASAPPLHPG